VRSGEYIPKPSYSDTETDYVYLTIGQFLGPYVSFEDLTFLEESVGEDYAYLQVKHGDLVVTRSGTVGVVHIFRAPDDKVYIPSHHLAIVEIPNDADHSAEYLRLFLQSEFPRKYFWAFASGKSQKEISNWSIKSLPIPQVADPHEVANRCQSVEQEILMLREQIASKHQEKEQVLYEAIRYLS
jgi:restriction endonuclease S subunit